MAKPSSQPESDPKKVSDRNTHPEFGRPSPLGAGRSPFNIPKPSQPRPEHHRPAPPPPPSTHHGRNDGRHPAAPFQQSMKPSAAGPYQSHNFQQQQRRQDDPIEIPRPSNYSYTTKPAPEPLFSSKPLSTGLAKAASNIKSFVDLTTSDIGFTTNNSQFKDEFGSADAYAYVDAAKANENIKALLEGAFEDEDDQPRTRLRKKKIEKQVADLAAKLGGVKVSDGKPDASGEAAEEEEEEEEDDGSREGLKVRLLPHQIEGVEWMRDKEAGLKKTRGVLPKGGILADDMGLGKTVQTIALLLCNPRPPRVESDSKKDKTKLKISNEVGKGTLVVAPVALIKQWESEIETKVLASHRLRVCVYHGPGRTKYATRLNDYDVVITTYGTLSSEHASSGTSANGKRTGCFGVHWYRIVLDEAHTIKNRNAKATQAAYALNSEYRWCLTGTPMQNNLDELQSLIRFLRIKPYDELAAWREQITRPLNNGRGGLAIRRLRVYLKAFMKRRTKDVLKLDGALGNGGTSDQANGKSSHGFQITEREILKIEADFSDEEREFYTRLEQRADKSLEKMIGRNNLSYASALVLLLRLRQACNHPDLVKGDLAEEKEALVVNEQSKRSGTDDVDSIADMLGGLTVVSRRCDVCQLDLTKEEASRGVVRCADCDGDLSIVAPKKPSKQKKTKKKKTKPTPPQKSDEYTSRPSGRRRNRPIVIDSDDEEEAEWIVPENERGSTNLGTAGGADDEDAEGGGEWLGSDDSATEEETEDEEEEEEDEDDSEAEEVGQSRADQVIASTKIRRLMKILKHESGSYKFIVFSVFTSMLDKIEPFLKTAKIGYARYDGKMRNDMREASLHKLRNSTRTRVLLCSLRAGSLGLNLTAASRVVILEPFWNPFVEEQAIDRVHRLNQTVDVKIYKMTIKNTVEERILDLQERKRELANATIEGKHAATKLTMRDMLALFRHDAEAKFVDDRDLDSIDFTGKARLLDTDSREDRSPAPTPAGRPGLSASSSLSSLGRRGTPPVVEKAKGTRQVQESSVYGRRW